MSGEKNRADRSGVTINIDPDLKEIIPLFFENIRNDIDKIAEALKSDDYETIFTLGHSFKGVGGGYGFDAVTDIGAAIETAGKEQDNKTVAQKLEELSTYLDNVLVIYE